jgi:hypothetical protein
MKLKKFVQSTSEQEQVKIRLPVGVTDFSNLRSGQTGTGAPLSLMFNGHRGLFPHVWSGQGMQLATHLHLVPTLRMGGTIPPRFRGVHKNNFNNSDQTQVTATAPICPNGVLGVCNARMAVFAKFKVCQLWLYYPEVAPPSEHT